MIVTNCVLLNKSGIREFTLTQTNEQKAKADETWNIDIATEQHTTEYLIITKEQRVHLRWRSLEDTP